MKCRIGPEPEKNNSRTEPGPNFVRNSDKFGVIGQGSSDRVVRGSLLIEMSEEVILVKSEDDENVPKSPVYLSETTSESSKPEAVSFIR